MNPKLILTTAKKNLPSILSWTAVGGVVLTGWLTHKAARKSDPEEPFKKHWKNYIPCGIAGLGTIACIIGSNCAHLKVEAGLAGAVAFYKAAKEDLEMAVSEVYGEEGLGQVKKAANDINPDLSAMYHDAPRTIRMLEPYTNQWFDTTPEELLWAELTANKMLSQRGTVKLNDVLRLYKNCKPKPIGETLGWSWEDEMFNESASWYCNGGWIDICPQYEERNGKRCYVLDYGINPIDISQILQGV